MGVLDVVPVSRGGHILPQTSIADWDGVLSLTDSAGVSGHCAVRNYRYSYSITLSSSLWTQRRSHGKELSQASGVC